ncbi:DUF2232 domain-containing protein [Deferribacter autotrophicus]|uniref:DUF2232 domain-containing protein n=1 Tax=Deferribacter autotrophicus TaxID=500465 RepID=A0A5A8F3T6_9BACT|nr:DUF2232 domain-containing protein [Deferribacter autotrophicus]KAA0257693.1 DUF2232 domain-containing protein [Deferribacter autotrophicus]
MVNPIPIIQLLASIILFTFNAYNPYFGFFFGLISPLFLLFYLNSLKRFPFELLIAVIIHAAIFKIVTVYYIFMVVIPSFIILTRKEKAELLSGLPALLASIIVLILLPEIKTALIKNLEFNLSNYLELLRNSATTEKLFYIEKIEKNKTYIAALFIYLMPSLSYSYIAFTTYINKRFFYKFQKIPVQPFQVPFQLIPVLVVGGFLILANYIITKIISYNTLIIFFTLFFVQGIEILEFWLKKIKVPIIFKYVIYFFILVEPPLTIILSIFGLFDTWIDFRKLNKGGQNG